MRRDRNGAPGALATIGAVAAVALLVGCSHDGRELSPPGPDQTLSIISTTSSSTTSTTVASSASSTGGTTGGGDEPAITTLRMSVPWADGGEIAARFTCAGDDVSPSITWTGVPADAVELAVLFTDLDSNPPGFVHWLIAGLDPASTGIAEGRVPTGAVQAENGFGEVGYGGPCPPEGTHTYLVTLYALRQKSGIADGAAQSDDLLTILETRSLASIAISGTATAVPGVTRPVRTTAAGTTAGTTAGGTAATTAPAAPTTTAARATSTAAPSTTS